FDCPISEEGIRMFGYYLRLALLSFRRTPGITALMILAMAAGISVCVMSLTLFHSISTNPIWWKSDQLYTVTMDNWSPNNPADNKHPAMPPVQMTYKDTQYLARSNIPKHHVVMFKSAGVVASAGNAGDTHQTPVMKLTRVTTADFFDMFEVPFAYGHGWKPA